MNKKEISKIVLFILSFFILFAVVAAVYIQAEKIKIKKIGKEIQRILKQSGNIALVSDPVLLKTPAQTSIVVFKLVNKNGKKTGYACLLRITGVCGPVPAVFVCDEQKNIRFAGIAGFADIPPKRKYGVTDMQVSYWTSRIRLLMEDVEK